LPFINGGEPMLWAPEIPIWFSLVFIAATIAVATVASLVKTRGEQRALPEGASPENAPPERAPRGSGL
jgi:tellurite resistance protein TerC